MDLSRTSLITSIDAVRKTTGMREHAWIVSNGNLSDFVCLFSSRCLVRQAIPVRTHSILQTICS
jgi:hypothetical protein